MTEKAGRFFGVFGNMVYQVIFELLGPVLFILYYTLSLNRLVLTIMQSRGLELIVLEFMLSIIGVFMKSDKKLHEEMKRMQYLAMIRVVAVLC